MPKINLPALTVFNQPTLTILALVAGSFAAHAQVSVDVYSMKSDGSNLRQLTHMGASNINRVRYSPDGTKIAFDVTDDGRGTIYIANGDGTKAAPLLTKMNAFQPVFTSDGQNIVFTGSPGDGDEAIYSITLEGTNRKLLVPDAISADISRDGTRLVYCRVQGLDTRMYVANSDGSGEAPVPTRSGCVRPTFDPQDNSTILDFTFHTLWTVKTDGSAETVIYKRADIAWAPGYSPDGKSIIFSTSAADNSSRFDIYSMKADGSGTIRLSKATEIVNFIEPTYHPSGKTVAFVGVSKLIANSVPVTAQYPK